jgi:hypothetical protein
MVRTHQPGPKSKVRAADQLEGTSKNGHRSSGTPDLPTNDSVLFSVRFCAVHPKDAGNFSRSPID